MMKKRKRKKSKTSKPTVGVGWYREDQWNLLLDHAADRNNLEATHGEWLEAARKGMDNLFGAGIQFEKIPIDVGEMIQWCKENDCSVDGKSRAEYITLKTREKLSR